MKSTNIVQIKASRATSPQFFCSCYLQTPAFKKIMAVIYDVSVGLIETYRDRSLALEADNHCQSQSTCSYITFFCLLYSMMMYYSSYNSVLSCHGITQSKHSFFMCSILTLMERFTCYYLLFC